MKIFLALGLLFVVFSAGAQQTDTWPGMGPRVVRLAQHLVSTARVLLEAEPGQSPRTIWVRTTRRVKKENGWFGLEVNGRLLEERYIFLEYGGRLENLQALFTLGSSLTGSGPFRMDEYPQDTRP